MKHRNDRRAVRRPSGTIVRALGALGALTTLSALGCSAGNAGTRPLPLRSAHGGEATLSGGSVEGRDQPGDVYRRAGLLVSTGDVPFVGSVRFLATPSRDSTLALVSLSLSNSALTFTHEGERGERARAGYDVEVFARRESATLHHATSHDEVRVDAAREAQRADESVIYQEYLSLTPGPASLVVSVHDAGSTRRGEARLELEVPRLGQSGTTAVVPVYDARPRRSRQLLPELAANPRATVVFGRDSLVQLYLEGYGLDEPLVLVARAVDSTGRVLAADTVPLVDRGSVATGVARLPVARLGLGVRTIVVTGGPGTGADPRRMPLVVALGDGLVADTMTELLAYLRYFASPTRLRALREAPLEEQPAAWLAFVHATDRDSTTPQNEALRAYVERLETANVRFREPGAAGWSTDRGSVYAFLGDPDQTAEGTSGERGALVRTLTWEYTGARLRLVFEERAHSGHWRLTERSRQELQDVIVRRLGSGVTP